MKKQLSKSYVTPILAWAALVTFLLLAIVSLIAIETITREYPKWHWWMGSVPVNIFFDAFIPVVEAAIPTFFIPFGLVTIPPILSHIFLWNKINWTVEIFCYILSITFLWFGFWHTGWMTDCKMLSLQTDGGPWGPCGYWAWYSRPLINFIWHTILWMIWSIALIGLWSSLKKKLIFNSEITSRAGVMV